MKEIKILELFAGVGGFRVGLENADDKLFKTYWSNQWEPSKKSQDAFEVYQYHFPNSQNLNINIEEIPDSEFISMDADLIVGGFPCQDYSVARSKKGEKGIEGKKGVLFWQIIRATKLISPKYLILENVDRLLKSPSNQRGRDFAIMLKAFSDLGYSVEWRVINAADYGRAQRRRRVFFFVYKNDTKFANKIENSFELNNPVIFEEDRYDNYIFEQGLFASQFSVEREINKDRKAFYVLPDDILDISNSFSGVVWNSGIMRNGRYWTIETIPKFEAPIPLKRILLPISEIPEKYIINDKEKLEKFKYLRGPKKIKRTSSDGHIYEYSEGGMSPFDNVDLPGRTMLTSEGTVNRSTHLLNIDSRVRLLTPIEAERLQDFPDDWTKFKINHAGEIIEVSDRMRMFFMGNALVTGIIERIGSGLKKIVSEE